MRSSAFGTPDAIRTHDPQSRRVLLARALCAAERILLLDEPAAGLDPKVTKELYELIESLNREGVTIIMISHDLASAVRYASHILHIGSESFFGTRETKKMTSVNPVIKGTRFAFKLMKNKLVISLLLIVQGLLFIFYPSGSVSGLIQTAAVIVIAATVINVLFHLLHKDRTAGDYVLAVLNIVLCVFAVFCLVLPGAIEPYVRAAVGAFTIGANLVSLVEVLRYENKKSWRFIVGIIAAIVMIVLGVAMIIAPENIIANIQIGIGWILILIAVINVWYIVRLYFTSRKTKQN